VHEHRSQEKSDYVQRSRRNPFVKGKPNDERKPSNMKNQNPLAKLTLLLAMLLTLGAVRAQADILPGVTIGFAPVA